MTLGGFAASKIVEWRQHPDVMAWELFGIELDWFQREALITLPMPEWVRLAMKACKNPGKTMTLSLAAWNVLLCYLHPKVIATSITSDNLSDGLWTEMAKLMKRAPLLEQLFQWNKTSITSREHPETWYMVARQWSRSADPGEQAKALAGKHADTIFYLLDEAGGIPDAVAMTAEAALGSGDWAKLWIAGNPTDLAGPLYRACTSERDSWKVIEVTGDPDHPRRAKRVNIDWARRMIKTHGRKSPWVKVDVLGEFPEVAIDALLGPDQVQQAMDLELKKGDYIHAQKRIGVDVARYGNDATVLAPRQGRLVGPFVEMQGADGPQIAARIMLAEERWQPELVLVDDTGGYGATVIDCLRMAGRTPIAVNFSGRPADQRFKNVRAEMWWRMAEAVKAGAKLPRDTVLAKELTEVRYTFTSEGQIKIEDKDHVKARLGRSPDRADALALSYALVEMPASNPYEDLVLGRVSAKDLQSLQALGQTHYEAEHDWDLGSD